MTETEILHLAKKIAQLRKSQCWLCHKLEKALDELIMESIRCEKRVTDSNDDNTSFYYDESGKHVAKP